jgi:Flp pilus assembly protein TadD
MIVMRSVEMLDKLLGKIKEDNKKNPDVEKYFGKGKEYVENQNFQPAIESFKRCIEEDPEEAKAYVGLCIAYSGVMDLGTAREYYEKLKDLDPYLAAQFANTPTGSLLTEDEDTSV